jgi:hypothetical protein
VLNSALGSPNKGCDFWGYRTERFASMTDDILCSGVHLRGRYVKTHGLEDWVIAKTMFSNRRTTHMTF